MLHKASLKLDPNEHWKSVFYAESVHSNGFSIYRKDKLFKETLSYLQEYSGTSQVHNYQEFLNVAYRKK